LPDTCEKCGRAVEIGDFPFCPHSAAAPAVVTDDIPGGMVVENGFPAPIRVYSHSEHRRLLAERGREIAAKWVPGDKHLTRWDTVDLEGAAALVTRGAQARAERIALQDEYPITVTDISFEKP
jgi:hypothetical protein